MTFDDEIDALGLLCPLPVLKLRKRLEGRAAGDVIKLMTDDPAARIDVAHFCTQAGHSLIGSEPHEIGHVFYVRKNETPKPSSPVPQR